MYEPIIGLEIHAELKTKTKIFCGCKNSFGEKPNSQVCPVCMGLPGTLPVLNGKVLELAVKAGISLNCNIEKISYHDRKNYFYPDLPKAYQISQNNTPLCSKGYIQIKDRKIRIERIHIEEDAGKLIHKERETIVDFNRCGVPLIEIVTMPDIRSSDEAICFLEELKAILSYADISDCKMQEGSLRCDVNVSLRPSGTKILGTRCEIKNLNSFSSVKSAIDYEINRQTDIYNSGNSVTQETLRWDDEKKATVSMRSKEDTADYRYFPEPDLLPIVITDDEIKKIQATLPELPASRRSRYINHYHLSEYDAKVLLSSKEMSDFFDECVSLGGNPKAVANQLMGNISKLLNDKKLLKIPFSADSLVRIISFIDNGIISNTAAKAVLAEIFEFPEKRPENIISDLGLTQISDSSEIKALVLKVLSENQKSVKDYKNGNSRAFGFLMGQVMTASAGKANPKILNNILQEFLNNKE